MLMAFRVREVVYREDRGWCRLWQVQRTLSVKMHIRSAFQDGGDKTDGAQD